MRGMRLSGYGLATLAGVSLLYLGHGAVMNVLYRERQWGDDSRPRNGRAQQAALEYALASRRDSLARTSSNTRELIPNVRVIVDPRLPPWLSTPVIASLAGMWKRVAGPGVGSPVIIALLVDTAATIHGISGTSWGGRNLPAPGYSVPSTAGEPCIVTLSFHRLPPADKVAQFRDFDSAVENTGLCAFFHVFGVPGAGVRSWLTQTRHEPVGEASWWMPKSRFAKPYAEVRRATGFAVKLRSERRERLELLACSAGDAEACGRLVTTPLPRAERKWGEAAMEEQPHLLVSTRREQYLGFFGSRRFLSDLVRDSGHERFARFWQSDQAMPVAFDKAFGETLEKHMEARIARDYETIARGAVVPWKTALVTILASALLLAAAIVNARGWELR